MIDCGVSYFGVRRVQHVIKDLENMVEHGATFVVHSLSENDWCLYYKTMGEIVKATQQLGLKAWLNPWSLGYVFGADDDSQFVPTNPEACQVDQFGRLSPAACLNQIKFRDFVKEWVDAALGLGADMLFWDEPHLYNGEWFNEKWFRQPGRWGCRCTLCQSLYQERFGEIMPMHWDDPGVVSFNHATLKDFLGDILSYSKTKGGKNAVCLLPSEFESVQLNDSASIASLACIDNLGTDPYPFPIYDYPPLYVEKWKENNLRFIKGIVSVCQKYNKDNHFWVQGYSIPADDHGYIEQVMDMAVENGIKTIAVWGFDGHRDMSTFACEQPDKVWEQIGQGFKRIQTI